MHTVKFLKIFQPFQCDNLVRLGKNHDGGYLVNLNDVNKSTKLISFGIGTDISFEEQFVGFNNCIVEAYDSSVTKQHTFFDDENRVLHSTNIDINNIQPLLSQENIFIKCDIEGCEYKLFDTLILNSKKVSGLVIEVHSINEGDNFNNLLNFIAKIDLKLVHIHVNNYFYYTTENGNIPDILELTFSSDSAIKYSTNVQLPNILDMPNNMNDVDFKIVF